MPKTFPMEQNHHLDAFVDNPEIDVAHYCRLIGNLHYLQVTKPSIAYSVIILSQFLTSP